MRRTNHLTGSPIALAAAAFVLVALFTNVALSQTSDGGRSPDGSERRPTGASAGDTAAAMPEDMRLWSFGDCNRRFPSTESPQYKECARIVGSEEARDARAYHLCRTSHERDPAEAERCKAAYQANKKLAKDVLVSGTGSGQQAPLSPDVVQRVKSIASVGAEVDRAAQSEAAATAETPPAVPVAAPQPAVDAARKAPPPDVGSASWTLIVAVGFLVIAIVLFGVRTRMKRNDADLRQY